MEESLPFLLGAIAPAIVEMIRQAVRWVQQVRGRQSTEERAFYAAIEEMDEAAISRFLERNIGGLSFETYAADATVRQRVDAYINRLSTALEQPRPPAG